jgi:hypothetical protein
MKAESKPTPTRFPQLPALTNARSAAQPAPAGFVEALHALLDRLDNIYDSLLLPGPPPQPPAPRSRRPPNSPELSSAVQQFSQALAACMAQPSPTPHQKQAVADSFERIALQLLAENGYDPHASD